MARSTALSPYQRVLGDALEVLHPRLSAYFSAIPVGSTGRGSGVFDYVGTPRRWLWPVLAVLARQGVLFPVDARAVPFTVTNTPVTGTDGEPAIAATRTFGFAGGSRTMVDRIGLDSGAGRATLVDLLGTEGRFETRLSSIVVDGELHLSSTGTRVRVGRRLVALPRALSPVVSLVERFDDARDLQHVTVILAMPLVGKLYEYSGYFSYEVSATEGTAT